MVLKVKESAVNERPAISRPPRDAREALKEMGRGFGEDILSRSDRVWPNSVVDERSNGDARPCRRCYLFGKKR